MFNESNVRFNETTIKRARRKVGWVNTGPKCCQLVREKNRDERFDFYKHINTNGDKFENVLFNYE